MYLYIQVSSGFDGRGEERDVKGFNSLLVYSVLINFRHSFIHRKQTSRRSCSPLTRVWSRG